MVASLSLRRVVRSRSKVFWVYAAVAFVLLLMLMYVVADRITQPASAPFVETSVVDGTVPGAIENDFIPTDRDISECISAIPKPGCGSEARGGWRQGLVLLAILTGIAFIAWRIVRSARKAKAADDSVTAV